MNDLQGNNKPTVAMSMSVAYDQLEGSINQLSNTMEMIMTGPKPCPPNTQPAPGQILPIGELIQRLPQRMVDCSMRINDIKSQLLATFL